MTVSISASSTKTSVDEPVVLHATRGKSGFVTVPYDEVPAGVQWWRHLPQAYEKEVAGNLRWIVKPEEKPSSILTSDGISPGRYASRNPAHTNCLAFPQLTAPKQFRVKL